MTAQATTTILRHRGPCGKRRHCWRPECRQAFPGYPTLEYLPDRVIAFCHRLSHPTDDPRLRGAA